MRRKRAAARIQRARDAVFMGEMLANRGTRCQSNLFSIFAYHSSGPTARFNLA
jgi:hypothetical protein